MQEGAPAATSAGGTPAPGYPIYPQGVYPPVYSATPQYPYPPSASQSEGPAQSGPIQGQGAGSGPYTPYPGGYPPQHPPGQEGGVGFPSGYPAAPPQYQPYTPYYYYAPPQPRSGRETYALVVSWLAIVLGALSILGGLLSFGILALVVASEPDNLAWYGLFGFFGGTALIGGIVAIVYGISRIQRKASRRFVLPPAGLFVALAVLILITGIVLWNVYGAPGAGFAVFPLTTLAAIVPSLAILAFTTQRLGNPSTRRHVWLSLFYGATLAPIAAVILELLASVVIYLAFLALGQNVGNAINNLTSTQNPGEIIAQLLVVSASAPIIEEGVKPLAAVLIMRRLRTPSEAFLVGMAGGIGFNMFEATGYITSEQADWIAQGILRSTAGLLHGVGAGMAALGWYYLINGKGEPLRWARGFGGILYALVQHGLFNGAATLINLVPPSVGQFLSVMIVPGVVPVAIADVLFMVFDGLIFVVLVYVTGRLRQSNTISPYVDRPPQPYLFPQQSPAVAAVGGVR